MKNLHWAITAYDKEVLMKNEDSYLIWYGVDIQIKHQETEQEAIDAATKIIKRNFYKLRSVFECICLQEAVQRRKAEEMNKEILKLNKKQYGEED